MTDPVLATRLAALANEEPSFVDGARVIQTPDAFEAILSEIDHAVLPVTLSFESDAGALTLVAAGRRLCAVSGTAETLAPDDSAAIKAAATAIADFADAAAGTLRVKDGPAPDDLGDATHRVSAAALMQAAGRVAIDPDAPFLVKVQLRAGDAASAWVQYDSDMRPKDGNGPKDLREVLNKTATAQLATFETNRTARCPSHSDPSLTLLAGALGEDTALALVSADEDHLLIAAPDDRMADVVTAFQLSL